ncbi:MAG: sigma-54 dependent transcriptional regulator [Spirochaetes bacterium]|jgi:DNA-binding NtrC family response regulator|nr:sigma-54 dependent transcriptional regulator [Spirochaetota bacterium]
MNEFHKIIVADDEPSICTLLTDLLSDRFDVITVSRGDQVLETIKREQAEIVILDIHLPGLDGIEILKQISGSSLKVTVVVLTASNSVQMAITAMRLGAYDYIVKPFDNDKLLIILKNISDKLKLESEVEDLRGEIGKKLKFDSLVGHSSSIQAIYSTIEKVINTNSTILISGASGTGKGVLARAIHFNSDRRDLPFKALDCSTIPGELIASELFGHEKGSFTGAVNRKIGKFEAVASGTLFLDEISNLSFDMQAKLLMVIQEREFERIGSNAIIPVNARIIAASNRNLLEMVNEGLFREDLYYRLNVVPVFIPPLKNRREDIPEFIEFFLKKYNNEYGRSIQIDMKARIYLTEYNWPGNVRQLENTIRRLVLLADHDTVVRADIETVLVNQQDLRSNNSATQKSLPAFSVSILSPQGEQLTFEELEKGIILKSLEFNRYNITKTAHNLGLARKTLHNKIRGYNIVIEKHGVLGAFPEK